METSLKILIPVFTMVSYRAPPKTVYNLIKGFSSYDVDVTLLTSELDDVFKFPENCSVIKNLSKSKLKIINNILEIHSKYKDADIIYTPIAREALLISKMAADKPIIAGPNINIVPHLKHALTEVLCDCYIAYNRHLAEKLVLYRLSRDKIRIIPHAIDIDYYSPTNRNKWFWKNFNISPDNDIILFVGRLEKSKGVLTLVKSFVNYIKPCYNNAILVIISSGGSYENQIVEIAKKHKFIYFIKMLPEEYMPVAYASADIGIFPSEQEGFGMVYLESMASGTPTVGVNSGGPREIISNGYDGVLMPDNSEKSIYEAVAYLLENESIRRKIGRHGRKTVEKRYSPRIVAKRFIDICSELLYEDNR